jgi:hypothetical protein
VFFYNYEHLVLYELLMEILRNLKIVTIFYNYRGWDISISIMVGYGLDGLGLIPGRKKRFLSAPHHPDGLWGPPSLLSNEYQGLPGGQSGSGVKPRKTFHSKSKISQDRVKFLCN